MTRRKRLTAPMAWGIPRKGFKWVVSPSPGPHAFNRCIPLLIVLRDILHYCDNAREGKAIVRSGKVLVDNRLVKDPGFPVGLMDTISMPIIGEHYRVLLDSRGRFQLTAIKAEEATWKLVRIEDKRVVKGGRLQLNLSDGRNLLTDDSHATRDTLKISIPDQNVLDSYPFKSGSVALLIGGKHVGQLGHVDELVVERATRPNVVSFKEGFSTVLHYVFVVGKQKPVIALPEGA